MWEELTAPPPEYLTNAAKEIGAACALIEKAGDKLLQAVDAVEGHIGEDRVQAMLNELEDFRFELKWLKEKFERGKEE